MNKLKLFEITKDLTHKEFHILMCLLHNPAEQDVYRIFNLDCTVKEIAMQIAKKINAFDAVDILNSDMLIFDTQHFDNILEEIITKNAKEIINENTECEGSSGDNRV